MKRYLVKRSENQADQIAITALKQMEEASMKLEKSQQSLNPVIPIQIRRLAWQEDIKQLQDIVVTKESNGKQLMDKAVKFARIVSMVAIIPALLSAIGSTLENINSLRPHGVTGFTLIVYGIIIPLICIIYNGKLRHFTVAYVQDLCGAFPKLQT